MAAAQLRIAPFEVVLDRVATFDGHRKSPCVLRCTPDSEQAVEALRSALGEALATARLADLLESSRFTPHLTIAYIDGSLAQPVAVQSIVWPVREFALVESHVRESRHEVLAQRQLTR